MALCHAVVDLLAVNNRKVFVLEFQCAHTIRPLLAWTCMFSLYRRHNVTCSLMLLVVYARLTAVYNISCRKEFNIDVLKHFIKLHEFRGKLIVDALRYDECVCACPCIG